MRDYLESEEHNPHLVDPLLTGTFERVGALVSRVVGTFEFEVQPLREYFAARHLYTTAPYSPPGKPVAGTRPDRFDALVRNSYWTNVTRFFCGFYDVGELGTLVDALIQLDDDAGSRLINQPRRIALMLLSDHVFGQSPKTMKKLIDHVACEPAFHRLIASDAPFLKPEIVLPQTAGRDYLFNACADKLQHEVDSEYRRVLRSIMSTNANRASLTRTWRKRLRDGLMDCHPLKEASEFGILDSLSTNEINKLTESSTSERTYWFAYIGRYEALVADPILYSAARDELFKGRLTFFRAPFRRKRIIHLEILSVLLNIHWLTHLCTLELENCTALHTLSRSFGSDLEFRDEEAFSLENADDDPLGPLTRFVVKHARSDVAEWRKDVRLWSILVDRGFDAAPEGFVFAQIAAISTAVREAPTSGRWSRDGFLLTHGLVERLHFARTRSSDVLWWKEQLAHTTGCARVLCLVIFLSWAQPKALTGLISIVEPMVDNLGEDDWDRLYWLTVCIRRAADPIATELPQDWFSETDSLSPRLFLVLIDRVQDKDARRRLSREAFDGYKGTDSLVVQQAAATELISALEGDDDVDWTYIGNLSRLSRRAGLQFLISVHFPQHKWSLPEDFAVDVLANCEEHSAQLVAICERSYRTLVARRSDGVSTVADRQGWF